jgi:hypothetical protein
MVSIQLTPTLTLLLVLLYSVHVPNKVVRNLE